MKVRVRVECKGKCEFLALCNKVGGRHTYQLKIWVETHICARILNNKQSNVKWVSKLVVEKRKSQGKVKFFKIMYELRMKYYVYTTKGKSWRTRSIVDEIIEEDATKQYNMLCSQATELNKQCDGNTVNIDTKRPFSTLPPKFGRFYFRFDGCTKGFTNANRSFIRVDGCHLKTLYDGQILMVVARDPNSSTTLWIFVQWKLK